MPYCHGNPLADLVACLAEIPTTKKAALLCGRSSTADFHSPWGLHLASSSINWGRLMHSSSFTQKTIISKSRLTLQRYCFWLFELTFNSVATLCSTIGTIQKQKLWTLRWWNPARRLRHWAHLESWALSGSRISPQGSDGCLKAIPPIPWLDRSSHAHFPVPGASGGVAGRILNTGTPPC